MPFVLGDAAEQLANLACHRQHLNATACQELEQDAVMVSYVVGLWVLPPVVIESCHLLTCFNNASQARTRRR